MSRRLETPLIAALAAALALSACKDVDRDRPAETLVLAAFVTPDNTVNPPVLRSVVPLPSDLAMRGAPQQPAGVQREVLFSYLDSGGFSGDQTITIPLRQLVRDPETRTYSNATEPPPEIDPATITAETVAIVRLDDPAQTPIAPEYVNQGIDAANPDIRVLRLRPQGGFSAGRYVVAVRGGGRGVKTVDGQPIGPDRPIMLIAPNKDLNNPEFQPPGGLTPAQLASLEGVNGGPGLRDLFDVPYVWSKVPNEQVCTGAFQGVFPPASFPDGQKACWLPTAATQPTNAFDAIDGVFPHGQLASIQTFTIAAPAVVVDSGAGVVPFPSDFLLGSNGKVGAIPGLPAPVAEALQTLDGFSTTSLLLAPLSGPVDATTITPANVLLFDLGSPTAPQQPALVTAVGAGGSPVHVVQPRSLVRAVGEAQVATAIGLQPAVPVDAGAPQNRPIYVPAEAGSFYLPPLQQKRRYLVVITDGVKDLAGKKLVQGTLGRLLLTINTPLFDGTKPEGQRSNVPGFSDAQAQGLQTLRTSLRALAPTVLQLTGNNMVMGYTVTTQSVRDTTTLLATMPIAIETAAGAPVFVPGAAAQDVPLTIPNVADIVNGTVTSLQLMDPARGSLDATRIGTVSPQLNPAWTTAVLDAPNVKVQIPVTVVIPSVSTGNTPCTAEAPCTAPLVMFHHGINGGRLQALAAAADLAGKGFVVAAVDAPFHGDRSFCETDADCAGGTCTAVFLDDAGTVANQIAPTRCEGGNPAGGLARDDNGIPVAAGNYFVSENFFRIRDAIRQDVFDQSAAIQALTRGGTNGIADALAAANVTVDGTRVYWTGISLGNIIGTSVVASNPRISRAALNVPGGTLADIFTQAPRFQPEVEPLLGGLVPGFTFDKVNPASPNFDPAVAQRYAQTLIVAKMVLDPADPINYASRVTSNGAAVYGQMVRGDGVVPNPFNKLLFENADIPYTEYITTSTDDAGLLHGLLLATGDPFPTGAVAAGARIRSDLANFLANVGTPIDGEVDLDDN